VTTITGLLASLTQFRYLPLTVLTVQSSLYATPPTYPFLNVHWQFKFKTDGTEFPATDASSRSLCCKGQLKCDGTRAETRFPLSAKRTSPFKSAGASVHLTTGSRVVRIGGTNAGYTMLRGSVKRNSYPLHSSVSPSLPLPCVTVCHHISTGIYQQCSAKLSIEWETGLSRELV